MDYYAKADPTCGELLRMRYLERWREDKTFPALHIGRTTYYTKELEALSTVGIYAAAAGLLDDVRGCWMMCGTSGRGQTAGGVADLGMIAGGCANISA